MSSRDEKRALRGVIRAARAARNPADDAAASLALVAAVRGDAAWSRARSVAAFVGVAGEPDTRPLLQAALAEGKTLYLPRVLDGPGGRSELVRVDDLSALAPGTFGLIEPRRSDADVVLATITDALDLVLVPGLAFASDGARLGHGAGHYDRLFAAVIDSPRPQRIGICFAEFLDRPDVEIPMTDRDVPMHAVATERGIVQCT